MKGIMNMAKSKTFWLTRDDDGEVWIWQYACHPHIDENGEWLATVHSKHEQVELDMCADGLALFTGVTLAPGERGKYQLVKKD